MKYSENDETIIKNNINFTSHIIKNARFLQDYFRSTFSGKSSDILVASFWCVLQRACAKSAGSLTYRSVRP